MKIMITGATGTVGREVIRHCGHSAGTVIVAGVRHPQTARVSPPVELRAFDLHDLPGVRVALRDIDVVFLLRPPDIADVKGVFKPLVEVFKSVGIAHVVFLSVQGADDQPLIPHHKIERLLRDSGIPYTFVRPGYFMQNLTTTLRTDIARGEIYLPAGRARFNWVDAADIGRAVATVLRAPDAHRNRAYVITGREQLAFADVAALIARVTGQPMRFTSPSLPSFFLRKWRDGEPVALILVMTLLHFLPRFSKLPPLSDDFRTLTGREPGTLENFVQREMGLRDDHSDPRRR